MLRAPVLHGPQLPPLPLCSVPPRRRLRPAGRASQPPNALHGRLHRRDELYQEDRQWHSRAHRYLASQAAELPPLPPASFAQLQERPWAYGAYLTAALLSLAALAAAANAAWLFVTSPRAEVDEASVSFTPAPAAPTAAAEPPPVPFPMPEVTEAAEAERLYPKLLRLATQPVVQSYLGKLFALTGVLVVLAGRFP